MSAPDEGLQAGFLANLGERDYEKHEFGKRCLELKKIILTFLLTALLWPWCSAQAGGQDTFYSA